MSAIEHYREAERILRDPYAEQDSLATAQVHATLALAGVTALARFGDLPANDSEAWVTACRVQVRPGDDEPLFTGGGTLREDRIADRNEP